MYTQQATVLSIMFEYKHVEDESVKLDSGKIIVLALMRVTEPAMAKGQICLDHIEQFLYCTDSVRNMLPSFHVRLLRQAIKHVSRDPKLGDFLFAQSISPLRRCGMA